MRPPLVCPSTPVARAVLHAISTSHSISVSSLISTSKEPRFVRARREAARTLFEAPYNWSLAQIGRALGGMHHTSIRHLIHTDDPKPRCRPNLDITAAAAADIQARIDDVEIRRHGLRAKLATLDRVEEHLRKALCLLQNDCTE